MNQYRAMKKRQQKEFNDFSKKYMFYAFSESDAERAIAEFMDRTGAADLKQDAFASIGAGGYVLRDHYEALKAIFKRQRDEQAEAIAADQTGENFIRDMFLAEMFDHEYGLTEDADEVLTACGMTSETFNGSESLQRGFALAHDYCIEHTG